MADCINRKDVIRHGFRYLLPNGKESPLVVFVSEIEKAPAATDVRPVVHGKWINDCDYHFRCSACGDRWVVSNGNPLDMANGWNFCPNCGAEMVGVENDNAKT